MKQPNSMCISKKIYNATHKSGLIVKDSSFSDSFWLDRCSLDDCWLDDYFLVANFFSKIISSTNLTCLNKDQYWT